MSVRVWLCVCVCGPMCTVYSCAHLRMCERLMWPVSLGALPSSACNCFPVPQVLGPAALGVGVDRWCWWQWSWIIHFVMTESTLSSVSSNENTMLIWYILCKYHIFILTNKLQSRKHACICAYVLKKQLTFQLSTTRCYSCKFTFFIEDTCYIIWSTC